MFNVQTDQRNKALDGGKTREYYLDLAGDWVDELPSALLTGQTVTQRSLWDDSLFGMGTKGRWGDLLVSRIEADELVYVAPRVGWAGISLARLAKKHGKRLTLFMPARKELGAHQLVAIEEGATPVFRKIAAMPVLNGLARRYAEETPGAAFIPFGLEHELVTAAAVKSIDQHFGDWEPSDVVSVVSTGTLTRSLQVAWPRTRFWGVAVARNLHDGEVGHAQVVSYHKAFQQPADNARQLSEFIDSAWNYDMKAFDYVMSGTVPCPASPSTIIWNVAGEARPQHLTPADIDSQREWGEVR